MTFSRSHAGMIGIISLFTGMIAPIGKVSERGYPFPFTDIQWVSYIFMIFLALGFYLVSVRKWRLYKIIGMTLLGIMGYMFITLLTDRLHTIDTMSTIGTMSWWWVFILIGCIALIYSISHTDVETETEFSIFSDMIIWAVWAFTLIGLTWLIASVSLDKELPKNTESTLSQAGFSEPISRSSWVILSPAFENIEWLYFDRKNDILSFGTKTASGTYVFPDSHTYSGKSIHVSYIWKSRYILSEDTYWHDGIGHTHNGYIKTWESIILSQTWWIRIVTEKNEVIHTGRILPRNIVQSDNGNVFLWTEKSREDYILIKDGITISQPYQNIVDISLSKSWYDSLARAITSSGENIILKNWNPSDTMREWYQDNSWQANGSHYIYITREWSSYQIIYDWVSIWKELAEIREVFLEKSWNGYAYFSRQKWENTYCLFTRYRWSICGLEWYMNPRIGADGVSVIYAWYKNGTWWVYRNTDTIVRDTGYNRTNISDDYVFFDITNPKQYIFIEKLWAEEYRIRKTGKIIPIIWKDVWLDVYFWYNNQVIMSVRDDTWWRIAEF